MSRTPYEQEFEETFQMNMKSNFSSNPSYGHRRARTGRRLVRAALKSLLATSIVSGTAAPLATGRR